MKYGGDRPAARELGMTRQSLQDARKVVMAKAARAGYAPDHDMLHPVPDGFRLKGTSTLYDEAGAKRLQWVKTTIDQERQEELFRAAVEAFASGLPRASKMPVPKDGPDVLMPGFLIGDHHLGMLSWDEETGQDYDLSIGEQVLCGAMDHLIVAAPGANQCVIIFAGDYTHWDGTVPETPTSKHHLDADSRFPKMIRVAIRTMRYLIEKAAAKYKIVNVIIEPGNHDLYSAVFLMECMRNIYENNPRIKIDTSPMHFHYLEFGANLIGVHHGHGAKMKDLPLIMATDKPEAWGRTRYRYWFTGHVHHDRQVDYTGCRVESLRILPPADAWAAQNGYRAQQDMKAVIFHREFGEVARHTVNPAMLRAA